MEIKPFVFRLIQLNTFNFLSTQGTTAVIKFDSIMIVYCLFLVFNFFLTNLIWPTAHSILLTNNNCFILISVVWEIKTKSTQMLRNHLFSKYKSAVILHNLSRGETYTQEPFLCDFWKINIYSCICYFLMNNQLLFSFYFLLKTPREHFRRVHH